MGKIFTTIALILTFMFENLTSSLARHVNDFMAFINMQTLSRSEYIVKTLTCCEAAATGRYVMCTVIAPIIIASEVRVIWICVYPALIVVGRVKPVGRNTARVQFTRRLTICQCGDTSM